jgi:hypothetical protein
VFTLGQLFESRKFAQNRTIVRFICAMTASAPAPTSVSDDRPLGDQPLPPVAGARPRAAHKGQQTKAAIVEAALGLATHIGLEGLSIGALAEARA